MRALVIGADGFAGRWLLRHLVESGDDVSAAVGPRYADDALPHDATPHRLDVRRADDVRALVGAARPDAIYYLAGVSQPGARENPRLAMDVAVVGAMHVLGAATELDQPVRILHVGTSHMYAPPDDGSPITEETPIRPASVYGAAKAAAEAALLRVGETVGIEVIAIRSFNHIGPGQSAEFVVPSLARQVVAIGRGEQEPIIRAGDLDVERDFTDVRDVVRAYRLLAVDGTPGQAYNVASGRPISVRALATHMIEIAGLTATIQASQSLTRPGNAARIVGNARKLAIATGWAPTQDLRQTLRDTLHAVDSLVRQGRPAAR